MKTSVIVPLVAILVISLTGISKHTNAQQTLSTMMIGYSKGVLYPNTLPGYLVYIPGDELYVMYMGKYMGEPPIENIRFILKNPVGEQVSTMTITLGSEAFPIKLYKFSRQDMIGLWTVVVKSVTQNLTLSKAKIFFNSKLNTPVINVNRVSMGMIEGKIKLIFDGVVEAKGGEGGVIEVIPLPIKFHYNLTNTEGVDVALNEGEIRFLGDFNVLENLMIKAYIDLPLYGYDKFSNYPRIARVRVPQAFSMVKMISTKGELIIPLPEITGSSIIMEIEYKGTVKRLELINVEGKWYPIVDKWSQAIIEGKANNTFTIPVTYGSHKYEVIAITRWLGRYIAARSEFSFNTATITVFNKASRTQLRGYNLKIHGLETYTAPNGTTYVLTNEPRNATLSIEIPGSIKLLPSDIHPYSITISPDNNYTVKVELYNIRLEVYDLEELVKRGNLTVYRLFRDEEVYVGSVGVSEGKASFLAPPGKYIIIASSEEASKNVTVIVPISSKVKVYIREPDPLITSLIIAGGVLGAIGELYLGHKIIRKYLKSS